MSEPILTLRSSIRPSLVRYALIRGSFLSGVGGLLLLLSGALLPLSLLKLWGLPLFLLGIALITWGLWPYRRLKSLENNPYRIVVDNENWLHFSAKGKPILSLPLENIDNMEYIETENTKDHRNKHPYGIAIFLKDAVKQKPISYQPNKDAYIYRSADKHNQTNQTTSLFLPYFSKLAFQELLQLHTTLQPDHSPD